MGQLYRRREKRPDGTIREYPTWWIKYYQHGKAIRESTKTVKEGVARRILRSREGDVVAGVPINPQMGRITFDEGADAFVKDYQINKRKTRKHAKRRIELHLAPAFGRLRMIDITTPRIRDFVAKRQTAGATNAEINRELACLKRMFTLAIQGGQLHSKPYIQMLPENNVRQGFFEREQFDAVRAALPAPLRPVVTFAFLTGWRLKSEILPLEWRQIDWQGRVVRLEPGTTKNGKGRTFPFTAAIEELLRDQKAEHDALRKGDRLVRYVFHRDGEPIRSLRGAWKAACKSAGCPGRIVHDFRRTAVRNLERDGVSRSAAMAMVGHKTYAIYERYAIADEGTLRDAAAKIDRAAAGVPSSAPSGGAAEQSA